MSGVPLACTSLFFSGASHRTEPRLRLGSGAPTNVLVASEYSRRMATIVFVERSLRGAAPSLRSPPGYLDNLEIAIICNKTPLSLPSAMPLQRGAGATLPNRSMLDAPHRGVAEATPNGRGRFAQQIVRRRAGDFGEQGRRLSYIKTLAQRLPNT